MSVSRNKHGKTASYHKIAFNLYVILHHLCQKDHSLKRVIFNDMTDVTGNIFTETLLTVLTLLPFIEVTSV